MITVPSKISTKDLQKAHLLNERSKLRAALAEVEALKKEITKEKIPDKLS